MQNDRVGGPVLALPPPSDGDDDDGYVSPDFDLPSESGDEEDNDLPAAKRSKILHGGNSTGNPSMRSALAVEEDEELALSLLRRRRR